MTLWVSYAPAQNDTIFFDRVKKLQSLFDETNYRPITFEDTSLQVIERISLLQRTNDDVSRSNYLEYQLALTERDYGLSLDGGYTEIVNPSIGDLEDNLTYRRKFVVGAEWNVLHGGFFENKVKARILEDRILREQMNLDASKESYNYLRRFDRTIYTFNTVKIRLLYERKAQLEKQYKVIADLVHLKKLKKEELIQIETRLSEVESLINVYLSYNLYLNPESEDLEFDAYNLPLIDLDYAKIFSLLGKQTDSLLATRDYKDYYHWYNEISLKAFARYNYYSLIDQGYRSFISTGVSFSIPIPFNHKLKNQVESERYKYDNSRLIQDRANLHEEILSTGYEFRYKLKQFIAFYQKRKLFMERLRVEKVKVRLHDNNIDPLQGLELYDDLLQIDIELVDLLQNMYLKALKIHSRIPHASIRDVVKFQTTEEINEYVDDKERSIYVWSKTFEEFNADFLAEYVIYNEFEKVFVAVSKGDTLDEKKKFFEYASQNAEVHYMIGDNNMIYEDDIHGYLGAIIKEYGKFEPKGIHLDVEPHTFEDWATEKPKLIKMYLEMIGKAKTYCKDNNLEFSVSIPLHYGEEVVDQLLEACDYVYFMCYENTKTDYIDKKITPYIDNGKDQIVLAFRTEDFNNRIEMEDKIKEVEALTSIDAFAYHDLRRLITFDRVNIEK
ncbi:MAG: hypothetical protein H6582_04350 [Crocinitomicaceae bacterium]|nr:hypothetical protein [Crocinitomicaceae bacterium]